jgi:PAS domain S-box-containing protein
MVNNQLDQSSKYHIKQAPIQSLFEKFETEFDQPEKFILDLEGIIAFIHTDSNNITGYQAYDLIGKSFSTLYPITETEAFLHDLFLLKQGKQIHTSRLLTKRNKELFWAQMDITPILNGDTELGFEVTLFDATDSFLSAFRQRKTKNIYSGFFDNQFIGIIQISMEDYCLLSMNTTAKKFIGSDAIHLDKLFTRPEDLAKIKHSLLNTQKVDVELALQNNKWIMLSLRCSPVGNTADGVIMDITELKKKDDKLVRLTHELDQFIYHSSHELRSPLASILGIINLIKLENDLGVIQEYTEMIESKINSLDNLLRKMITVSYKQKATYDLIDWQTFIQSILINCCCINSKVEIGYELNDSKPFYSDLTSIRIIFHHLITNALKYYNPAQTKSTLQIIVEVSDQMATIQFIDNGIGIEQQYVKHIFNIFFKAHHHSEGHGLGLYIVKTMVDNLKGDIMVKTEEQKGSNFIITLPNHLYQTIL